MSGTLSHSVSLNSPENENMSAALDTVGSRRGSRIVYKRKQNSCRRKQNSLQEEAE